MELNDRISLDNYQAKGGSVNVSEIEISEPVPESYKYSYMISPVLIMQDLTLEDGDTVYYRVVYGEQQKVMSGIETYTFKDYTLVDHPQTGDVSNMLRYATLLSLSLLALCVLQLRKKET